MGREFFTLDTGMISTLREEQVVQQTLILSHDFQR